MKINRTVTKLVGAAVIAGAAITLIPAALASAHVPSASADCDGVHINAVKYHTEGTNTASITIDGAIQAYTFGTSFAKDIPFNDPTVSHSWSVYFRAWDDLEGVNGWTKTFSGGVAPCVIPTTTIPTTTTVPEETTTTVFQRSQPPLHVISVNCGEGFSIVLARYGPGAYVTVTLDGGFTTTDVLPGDSSYVRTFQARSSYRAFVVDGGTVVFDTGTVATPQDCDVATTIPAINTPADEIPVPSTDAPVVTVAPESAQVAATAPPAPAAPVHTLPATGGAVWVILIAAAMFLVLGFTLKKIGNNRHIND